MIEMSSQLIFMLLTLFGVVFGLFFPSSATMLQPYISVMLFSVMVVVGANTEFGSAHMQWGSLRIFALYPVIKYACSIFALGVAYSFTNLSSDEYINIILLAISPSAASSILISSVLGLEVVINVVLTFIITLLSPLTVTILGYILMGEELVLDPLSVILKLACVITLPVLFGYFIIKPLVVGSKGFGYVSKALPSLVIALLIAVLLSQRGGEVFFRPREIEVGVIYFVSLVLLVSLVVSFLKVGSGMARCLVVEGSLSNTTVAVFLAAEYFSASGIGVILAVTLFQNIAFYIMYNIWYVAKGTIDRGVLSE